MKESSQLLESSPTPFVAAAFRAGFTLNRESGRLFRNYSTSYFNKQQLVALNERPEIRAYSTGDIADAIGASRVMVADVAAQEQLRPVFQTQSGEGVLAPDEPIRSGAQFGLWYDVDQVLVVQERIKQFDAPVGFIGQTAILNTLDIGPVALDDICRRLEITGTPFRNPQLGHQEYHFKDADILRLADYVIKQKRLGADL
ncbi:MAG TPA: hypothetical protein VH234_04625 [Candidatus Saccharimonadales bacterium]|jgi:hypothetical protein|nr:hypothetical protein [Candidatus Saccharimonadales bacterium]